MSINIDEGGPAAHVGGLEAIELWRCTDP